MDSVPPSPMPDTSLGQAPDTVAELLRHFQATFEQAAVGLAHVGTNGRWLRVNSRLCDMVGYPYQELMELTFQDITHPDDLAADLQQLQQVLAGEISTYAMEKRYFRKSGETIWVNLTVSLVRKPEGAPDYFIAVIEDITRRHRAEMERDALLAREHQARTEAEQQVRSRSAELDVTRNALIQAERLATAGQLAAGVGHEINNPLSYVLANVTFALEELAERELDETMKEVEDALQQARRGAERIRGIVRDLRTFASSKFDSLGTVDVREALEFAVAMAEHQLRLRARLLRDYTPVPSVVGNESRLGQVFLNLLLNATQSLPEGAVSSNQVTLTIRPHQESWVAIEVRDTGCGIPEENLPRLFEPFFTTKPIGEGTGLGLSVCHGIVTSMGGQLQVESKPGRGSTFRVLLPVAGKAVTPEASGDARVRRPGEPEARRVLVIDDEPEVIEALARTIGPSHTIERAGSGTRALELLARDAGYDVIFCDLMMPELTGMDLYEVIASKYPELLERMVFMTAGGFTPRAIAFVDQHGPRCIEKPFSPETVRACLR
ncbi:PAS domain S-box-containing protein [Archangium gephyra]|uniref:histidine kinase n=2 Tax=Archangium gephyra TaxID=48 RepID=A0AAC8TF48_9BACT|nr:Sensory box histidine kinase/response regulator [Archangium gephyra]REG22548.1 PAS domain S-box-containing protein [Archangium gephyra]